MPFFNLAKKLFFSEWRLALLKSLIIQTTQAITASGTFSLLGAGAKRQNYIY